MKLHPIPRALALLAVACLASFSGSLSATPALPAATSRLYLPAILCDDCTGGRTPTEEVQRAIDLINEARVAAGCPAAIVNENLMRATQGWSEYLDANDTFEHAPASWYFSYDYYWIRTENIGGRTSAEAIVNWWLASPGHSANILWCPFVNSNILEIDSGMIYEIGVGRSSDMWVMGIGLRQP